MGLTAAVGVTRGDFVLDVELHAADRQVVAVLGPNGAGKSTLLRALAGLVPLTSGSVHLGDRCLEAVGRRVPPQRARRVPPAGRRVGVVFQDYRLFPHLCARENVAFAQRSGGVPRATARASADAWLTRLGLAGLGDRRPHELSGGQAQRVALARALAAEPELLLLDEPLAALDALTRDEVRTLLATQLSRFEGPTLLVTHDLVDALTLGDRVVVVEDGHLVQDDPPAELVRRPRTAYVAQLVGLNFWQGDDLPVGLLPVDGRAVADGRRPVIAVARPDAVRLHVPSQAPGASRRSPARPPEGPAWTGAVTSVQRHSDRVRVRLDGARGVTADVDLAQAAALPLRPGEVLAVTIDPADVEMYS